VTDSTSISVKRPCLLGVIEDFKLWHKIIPELPAQLCTFPGTQTFYAAECGLSLALPAEDGSVHRFRFSGEARTAVWHSPFAPKSP